MTANNSSVVANATTEQLASEGLMFYQFTLFWVNVGICSVNLVGNVTVIVLICRRRLLGRTTNVFVFSIAMADTICCVGAIPYFIFLVHEMSMSVYLCKGYFYALYVSRTVVSYTVVLLTTEKILNIIHPARFITAGRCMFFINLVWFFSVAYNVWTVVFYTIYDPDAIDDEIYGKGKRCYFSDRFEFLRVIFLSLDFGVLFLIPCFIVVCQFIMVIKKQHGSIKQRFESYFYIMRFLFFIFFVFITCHTPIEVATILRKQFGMASDEVTIFYDFSNTLYFARGVFNLIVYIYFKQYVCRRKRQLTNANNANADKTLLELPDRKARPFCRGMSLNEFQLLK